MLSGSAGVVHSRVVEYAKLETSEGGVLSGKAWPGAVRAEVGQWGRVERKVRLWKEESVELRGAF